MAHIVGVPKREPCQQCGNPVFFAERLTIGEFLYHRTCLKCARCGSQLTPGSFYETEIDGVFCCETCPDEEKKIQLGIDDDEQNSEHTTLESDQHRQSFSEKLAMFQTNGKGLLQKSMSDEEKSKSLKRLSELSELYSKNSIQENAAIEESPAEQISTSDGKMDENLNSDSGSDESDDDDDNKPPTLPKTQPPSLDTVSNTINAPPIPSKVNVLNKLKMQSSPIKSRIDMNEKRQSLQSNTVTKVSSIIVNDQSSQIESLNSLKNIESATPDVNASIKSTTENTAKSEEKTTSIPNDTNELLSDALNNFTDVTKEINEITKEMSTDDIQHTKNCIDFTKIADHSVNMVDDTYVECLSNIKSEHEEEATKVDNVQRMSISSNDCNENKLIDTNTNNDKQLVHKSDNNASIIDDNDDDDVQIRNDSTDRNNQMVRSRLSQFEALLQSDSKQITHKRNDSPRLNRSPIAIESRTNPLEHDEIPSIEIFKEDTVAINDQINESSAISAELNENNSLSIDANGDNTKKVITTIEKPTPFKRASKNVCQNENDSTLPPTPTKRRNRVPIVEEVHPLEKQQNDVQIDKTEQVNVTIQGEEKEEEVEVEEKRHTDKEYPDNLNPFGSDDEEKNNEENQEIELRNAAGGAKRKDSSNPFDSSDDEVELLKNFTPQKKITNKSRISTNPFGSDSEDEFDIESFSSKRTPIPTPRKPLNGSSLHSTPEPSPRMSQTLNPRMRLSSKLNDDFYGSNASIASSSNYSRMSSTLYRSSQVHGSMTSLASSTPRHKKGRAPDVPVLSKPSISANSSPSHSMRATPNSKKKRAAPPPPKPISSIKAFNFHEAPNPDLNDNLEPKQLHDSLTSNESFGFESSVNVETSIESPYISSSTESPMVTADPIESTSTEIKSECSSVQQHIAPAAEATKTLEKRKLIPVDSSLLDDFTIKNIAERTADENITYRRKIVPDLIVTPIKITDRQCEKMKENKESQNKNRQSQVVTPVSLSADDSSQLYSPNKSSYGKWKRRKGPAPSLPIPPRKVIQMLPLQEIRHELEVIEVQQQGLEKQGVILEKMIRERCEGTENENKPLDEFKPNTKEVEDLILQLFELVNEKNELFRRQAELMYLRRQHRLEQEQADIEYEIRVLMAQPECNKTDSDKSREEALISRLVEVVQLRNEVIESLEMDRIREAEEDQSIKERLELHTAKLDEELCQQTPTKLSKKEKKKQKESKKLAKQKKVDADKDADESEIGESEKVKEKKKKKKFLF